MDTQHQNLIQRIKKAQTTYSRAFKQLAKLILDQTFVASTMSIEELAQAAGVSVATVNRFAHECGYVGYPQFRTELRGLFDKIFEPVEKVRSDTLRQSKEEDIIQNSLAVSAQNIQKAQHILQQSRISVEKAVTSILSANNIFVAGMGVSALHASFMVDCLEPFLPKKIREMGGFCGAERAFRRMGMVDQQDLIIAITLPRYSKSIVELLYLAKAKGCKILALTDESVSPVVPLADITLFAPSEHPVLYASNASMIALIEAISSAIVLRVNQSADYIAQQTQNVLPYLYLPTDEQMK